MEKIYNHFDFIFNKLLPKKLVVMLISTIALFKDKMSDENFIIVCGIYMGVNIIGKFSKMNYKE